MTSTSVEFYTQQMDSARNSRTSVTTSKKYVNFLEETLLKWNNFYLQETNKIMPPILYYFKNFLYMYIFSLVVLFLKSLYEN